MTKYVQCMCSFATFTSATWVSVNWDSNVSSQYLGCSKWPFSSNFPTKILHVFLLRAFFQLWNINYYNMLLLLLFDQSLSFPFSSKTGFPACKKIFFIWLKLSHETEVKGKQRCSDNFFFSCAIQFLCLWRSLFRILAVCDHLFNALFHPSVVDSDEMRWDCAALELASPHPSAVAQTTQLSQGLSFSLSDVDCFCILWNGTFIHLIYFVLAKVFNFIRVVLWSMIFWLFCIHYWCLVSSWNQVCILHWKWIQCS